MEHNPFAAPGSDTYTSSRISGSSASAPLAWFPVGNRKLWVLSVLTAGIYTVYWFERQFRFQKRARFDDTWPVARAIFSIFYANDLFKRVEFAAKQIDVHPSWTAVSMAVLYSVSAIAGRVIDRVSAHLSGPASSASVLLYVATVFCCVYAVARVNSTLNTVLDREPGDRERNEHFTVWNWILSVLCALFWVAATVGLLFPDIGETNDVLQQ